MSENKHGQGAQWSKSAVTSAAVTAAAIAAATQKQQHEQHVQHAPIYNATALSLTSPAGTSALYRGAGHIGGHQLSSDVTTYAAARFQAPPIDHRSASSSSSHIVPPTPSPSSNTNVPVPSGFVPPPYSPVASAATSVLTPNPYAVASLTVPGTTHTNVSHSQSHTQTHPSTNQQFSATHTHFGMEQFQHLNVQQQYELSKLMAASFSTTQQVGESSGPTNLSSTPLPSAQSASTNLQPGMSNFHASTTVRNPTTPSSCENISSGNINSQVAEQVISSISTGSMSTKLAITPIHGRLMGLGVHAADEEKLRRIQQIVESGIGDHAKQQIVQILDRISILRPIEKLLLYLRLPGEQPETDPLRQPQNPLGTRSEINHTINWVRTHLEQDPQVSIPKQDVYNDYLVYCDRLDIKPLSTADFGKVMKQVFPGIRPRRLGTRGHSRYCYAAMRKTSKLPPPHLPTLATVKSSKSATEKDGGIDLSMNIIDTTEEQEESWNVVKNWAETMLHIKIDNITELATHIKSSGSMALAGGTHIPYAGAGRGATSGLTHKKLTQREPKEKRVMADMGPLKKRRKKKRKGSSSSESSYNQNVNAGDQKQIQPQLSPANSSKSSSHHNVLSPATEDSQKLKIKQEIIDSPGYPPSIGSLSAFSQSTDSANATQYQASVIAANTLKMPQHQVMPMNLAAETRGLSNVLARAPSTTSSLTASAFEHVRPSCATTPTTTMVAAVKNLTPKIMELSAENQTISSPTSQTVIIKQEIGAEDYNTSNIFCKKVRKAQQTKGFWANSPTTSLKRFDSTTTSASSFPIVTTTASTPPPIPATVISTPSNNTDPVVVYNMGPPTQMAPSTSPNNQSINDDVNSLGQPKVLSRNLQQLKAKKIMAAAAAAASDPPDLSAAKDTTDLPENLGLPRERVISICNMDKHELDDYFLPVEEENSEDQETELLQYFQMGDAEEKLIKNSSSDAKRNSNSTVNQQTSITTSITKLTTTSTTSAIGSLALTSCSTMSTPKISTGIMMSTYKYINNTQSINDIVTDSQFQNEKTQHPYTLDYPNSRTNSLNKLPLTSTCLTATTSSPCPTTVGTASASLVHLTQKHQQMLQPQQLQQQSISQHQQQPKTQPQLLSKISFKRKINLNTRNTTTDITAARKNYSFLPISPNINSTTTSSSNNTLFSLANNNINTTGTGFFASPGLSRLLTKQQSLDCDTSSDPMIGATRRLRSYNSMMTSASAPPSPSVLKQQQEQHMFGHMTHNMLIDQWSHSGPFNNTSTVTNVANSLMNDQNSLDLDLFGEAAAAAASTATNATFSSRNNFNIGINHITEGVISNADCSVGQMNDATQRSQSVPLSQLQRTHSPTFNHSFHCNVNSSTAISACNSLAQTPVPSEFIDSGTILSENSCSQQSATIKLEEVANVVASDSTAILDEVDVSEILSSPDFVAKFSSLNPTSKAKTTCSSAGSSSGYSSTGHFSLSCGSYGIGGGGNGVGGSSAMSSSISRSVPSTPLPHQNPQSLFGNSNNFYRRRFINNCQSLNGGVIGSGVLDNLDSFSNNFASTGKYVYGNIGSSLSRSACDISKSMPSTPITTTPSSFRYSPSEFTRDFLINGNTIDDSIASSFGAVGSDNLMSSDVMVVDAPLNSESLLNEEDTLINGSASMNQVDSGVLTSDFTVQSETSGASLGAVVGESSIVIGVGSDLLDNL